MRGTARGLAAYVAEQWGRPRITIDTSRVALALALMACDDDVIPLQERIATVTHESDMEEFYNTKRHLLYVACNRARDRLWAPAWPRPRSFWMP